MDSPQSKYSPIRGAVLPTIALFILIFISTPALQVLNLSGNIDAISSGLLVIGLSFAIFLLGKNTGTILASLLVVGAILFNSGSKKYYDLQQFYLTKDTVYLVSELRSLVTSYETVQITIAAATLLLMLSIVVCITRGAYIQNAKVCLLASTVCIFSFVSLQFVYASVTDEEFFYNNSAVPIGHFARSTQVFPFIKFDKELEMHYERETLLQNLLVDQSLSLPDKFAASNIGALLGESADFQSRTIDPRYPLYRSGSHQSKNLLNAHKGLASKNNVIILVLESVQASEMGLYGAKNTATPFLDSLGENAIFASNFYANSNFTVKSEHAIHCSTYDLSLIHI